MPKAHDLKRGMIVDIDGTPHEVEAINVQTPSARGGASLYKLRFRNVKTKQKVDRNCKGDDAFKDADLVRREVQYLYSEQDQYTFMDMEDYSQFTLNTGDIENQLPYLAEEMEGITAMISDGHVIAIEMPPVVDMPIVECAPGMKGASATSRTKPATMPTGLIVQVPEYIEPGEMIRIDTRDSRFLQRA